MAQITQLLQQIRLVENDHNQLVDQYFQLKEQLKQALTNLNTHPTADHLNVYNQYLIQSETMMKAIRSRRLTLTHLICDLQQHGISFDDDDDDEEMNSSVDEGIDDEHSLSILDLSSKLSSHDNSEHNEEEI